MTLSNTVRSALLAGSARRGLRSAHGRDDPAGLGAKGTGRRDLDRQLHLQSEAKLTVKAGTTVTWTNKDDIPHGIASSNNAFTRSKPLVTDDSFSFTFTTPGTYQFFCYLHPNMVGTVVVEAATGSTAKP